VTRRLILLCTRSPSVMRKRTTEGRAGVIAQEFHHMFHLRVMSHAYSIRNFSLMTTKSAVTLKNVTRRFARITAVDQVSLEIEPGQAVALLGPNGAGKTTTVEMVLALIKPDDGVVNVFGASPADAITEGRVGAMLQDSGLPEGARVAELIALIRSLYPNPLTIEETLRLSDLSDVAGRQVQRLSGGQRQRVRLAMALAGNPELLILDEPTAALDVEGRRAFWRRARSFVSQGRTLLFATHRLEEADSVADRVVVIAAGRVVAEGTPNDVKARAIGRSEVRFSADGVDGQLLDRLPSVESVKHEGQRITLYTTDPDVTVRALLQLVSHIEGLEIERAGMEEAFLSLTRREES
jgi:ABC-2 type transport system ATP-binding protein